MSLCSIFGRTVPGKPKGKGLPTHGHEGTEAVTCVAPLSLTSAIDVGG
jgi:hypothetical protein